MTTSELRPKSDSQSAPPLNLALVTHNFPVSAPQNSLQFAHVVVSSLGDAPWRSQSEAGNPIVLLMKIGETVVGAAPFPTLTVASQQRLRFSFQWQATGPLGGTELVLEWAEQNVAILGPLGRWAIDLTAPLTARGPALMSAAQAHNSWFYLPSQGVYWSRHSRHHYPLFVQTAKGSRFWDADGEEFIDYVSGWGACLLGYGEPRVRRRVQRSLASGSLTTLPNVLEMELTAQLCDWFPSAEMATYGKNGSDVCTAAVRLARAYTQRPKVFYCGYHGWQDWNAESFGHTRTAIPPHASPVVAPFPSQDAEAAMALFHQHPGQIAALVIEPAAQIEGLNGPIRPANGAFLATLLELCRANGALLIFDEIFTGFRYLKGSVQQATGVQPDLTCLGKSLSAGMPLSALIGRRDVFQEAMSRIAYDSTFKGEPHSFAAALTALEIYRQEPVVEQVWQFGQQLMQGINQLCQEMEIPAKVVGLPIRMTLAIDDIPDADLIRTFVQQQLLLQGILCFRGFMIPSYAHSLADLKATLRAYQASFGALKDARERDTILAQLEIPIVC
ncbi:MAG: aminotransferase class III-fold pyridoxal phosphate-dependent enzyme [Cyanobacteria bacterium P01_A01_bin.135]